MKPRKGATEGQNPGRGHRKTGETQEGRRRRAGETQNRGAGGQVGGTGGQVKPGRGRRRAGETQGHRRAGETRQGAQEGR